MGKERRGAPFSFVYSFVIASFFSGHEGVQYDWLGRSGQDFMVQSSLFISMHRNRHPYAYRAFILVRRVDLSHTNLVGSRAGMLVGGLCVHTVCL